MSAEFSPDQKRYLEGFMAGAQALKGMGRAVPVSGQAGHDGPDKTHLEAQDGTMEAGKKLADQEKWKRDEHPFDAYARFKAQAKSGAYPKPEDNFRWRYFGLYYVGPAQNSYMCRLRIPNGILKHWQFAGLADLADAHGGPYAHVTTRANLQLREITAEHAPDVIEGLGELGLTAKGSGADNIRNVTGSATAGIDPQELLDTRPHARDWHRHVLEDRSLYGLPRKFNVAFDGGGRIATLEDTNDIGFQAVEVLEGGTCAGEAISPGIWYRLALGGITGHRDLARDTGVIVKPDEAIAVADAVVRVFIDHGDRSNRAKARLKYVLDAWGFEKFLAAVEEKLGRKLVSVESDSTKPRPAHDRMAHIGVHPQKQPGLNWIGVALPVGRMTTDQMRALARMSVDLGDGDIRLTVWQNLVLSGVSEANVPVVLEALKTCGLSASAKSLRAGLVACTGATGCKFAAAYTKEDALAIADHVDSRLTLDGPVNVHLTGCHHSCAQHYIGDLGLIGAKVPVNEEGDTVHGYHVLVGGGFGNEGKMARELIQNVKAEDAPQTVERILRAYLSHRSGPDESFHAFTGRHETAALAAFVSEQDA